LDDVFLQLTGSPPSEDGAGPEQTVARPSEHQAGRLRLRLRLPSARKLREDITDAAVVTGRNLRHFVREPGLLVFSTIQPIMFVVGYIVGFRFHGGVDGALASIALVAAFGLALSWIFAFVALTVRGAEAVQTAGFVVIFPLVFASSIFVPLSTLPGWLEAVAKV